MYLSCTSINKTKQTGLSAFISTWEDRATEIIEHKSTAIRAKQFLSSLPRNYTWSPPASEVQTIQSKNANPQEPDISNRFEIALGNLVHTSLKWLADSRETDLQKIRNRQLFWSNKLLIDEESKSDVVELSQEHISVSYTHLTLPTIE